MIISKIENFIVNYITKSVSLTDLDAVDKLIKEKKTLKLKAATLYDLQLLSDAIFSKDDLEMVGKIKICWSWRYFEKVWIVTVRRVSVN